MKLLKRLWPVIVALLCLILDQRLKRFMSVFLADGPVQAIPGVFTWYLTTNTGAAFSFLSDHTRLLSVFSGIVLLLILAWLYAHPDNVFSERLGFAFIAGGGAGNLLDRIRFSQVTDYIRLDFIRFAIFNLADIFICIGVFITALGIFVSFHPEARHG